MHTSEIRITNPDWVRETVDVNRPYPDDESRIRVAIALARENVLRNTGGPFGAAVFEAGTVDWSGSVRTVSSASTTRARTPKSSPS
jgi:hypothetical protein